MFDLVAAEFEIAPHDIEDDVAHGVADVAGVVRRYPADVHFHLIPTGDKFVLLTRKGAIDFHLTQPYLYFAHLILFVFFTVVSSG
ncbi:MAG: hypothetical protein DDT26_02129 [Dehalococcoidia bacterium]|nr:hypothetical protein [Chloroflexota bacterium]